MFGLFKKKTEIEILQKKYAKLMEEAFELSKINRSDSDKKHAEAEDIMKRIDLLKENK